MCNALCKSCEASCKESYDEGIVLKKIEATMGFEPMMRVLQTLALPLGHVA